MSEQHLGGVATVARSTLLKRAAIAGGLIVVLLVALGWFERSQAPAPEPAPVLAEAPPPPTDALPAGAPPMPSAADVEVGETFTEADFNTRIVIQERELSRVKEFMGQG